MTRYDNELLDKQFHRINATPFAEGLFMACAFSVVIVVVLLGIVSVT